MLNRFLACCMLAAAAAAVPAISSIPASDLRWTATALKPDRWKDWFDQQIALAPKAVKDNGLYVGLRLDGRVRASGMGCPPWGRFTAELAPLEGELCGIGVWHGWGPCTWVGRSLMGT